MPIISQNPSTEEIINTFEELTLDQIQIKIENASRGYAYWKETSFEQRSELLLNLAQIIKQKRGLIAGTITLEMGMPIAQALVEVEKAAWVIEFYAQNGESFLKPEIINIGAKENYVRFDPLGVILCVAPWNFPIYLALRPAIPAIMAGNIVLLKHASNVPACSLLLEELFNLAGFPKGVFQSLLIEACQVEPILRDERIVMATLIGSETAGSKIGAVAGSEIKKTVMELGGSDAFIVLADANLDKAIPAATASRLRNAGQSCNAAKRFIVHQDIAEEFISKLKIEFEKEIIGNPDDKNTTMGPVATEKSLAEIESQVRKSVKLGAKIIMGGKRINRTGYYFEPTILANVLKGMPVYDEEVFGPVAPIIIVKSLEEAIEAANNSKLGLGCSIWTQNHEAISNIIPKIEAGNVFINSAVRSDPNLPYGGIKKSGFGREFGEYGIKEFVNIKTVVVR